MPACDSYIAHAFKKDVCRECGMPKTQHGGNNENTKTITPAPVIAKAAAAAPVIPSKPAAPIARPVVQPVVKPTIPSSPSLAPPSTATASSSDSRSRSSSIGDKTACENFVPNAFVGLICRNCTLPRTAHEAKSAASAAPTAATVAPATPVKAPVIAAAQVSASPVKPSPAPAAAVTVVPAASATPTPNPAISVKPNSSSCSNPEPYGFNKSKCKNCQQQIEQHVKITEKKVEPLPTTAQVAVKTPTTLPAISDALKPVVNTKACKDFEVHAFFPQKCRACGQPKTDHVNVTEAPATGANSSAVATKTEARVEEKLPQQTKPKFQFSPSKPLTTAEQAAPVAAAAPVTVTATSQGIHARLASLGSFNPLNIKQPGLTTITKPAENSNVSETDSITSPPSAVRKPTIAASRRQASLILPQFTSPTATQLAGLTSPVSAPAPASPPSSQSPELAASQLTAEVSNNENETIRLTSNSPMIQPNTVNETNSIPNINNIKNNEESKIDVVKAVRRSALFDENEDEEDTEEFFKTKKTPMTTNTIKTTTTNFVPIKSVNGEIPAIAPDNEDDWDVDDVDESSLTQATAPPVNVYQTQNTEKKEIAEELPQQPPAAEKPKPVESEKQNFSNPLQPSMSTSQQQPTEIIQTPKTSTNSSFFFPGKSITNENTTNQIKPPPSVESPINTKTNSNSSPRTSVETKPSSATFFRANSLGFSQSVKDAITIHTTTTTTNNNKKEEKDSINTNNENNNNNTNLLSNNQIIEPKIDDETKNESKMKKGLFDEDDDLFGDTNKNISSNNNFHPPPPQPPAPASAALASATAHSNAPSTNLKLTNPLTALMQQRQANQQNVFDDDDFE